MSAELAAFGRQRKRKDIVVLCSCFQRALTTCIFTFQAPPLILLAGDCTGSAYVFAPRLTSEMKANLERINSKHSEGEDTQADLESVMDVPNYELAFEIQCGSTVGSAAVAAIPDGSGDVEIFVPSYELSKVSARFIRIRIFNIFHLHLICIMKIFLA